MLRLDDMGKYIGSFCFWACSSSLLVHPKRERPREARVVTSYTSVVLDMRDPADMIVLHGVTKVDVR